MAWNYKSKPIEATPILRGEDLRSLVRDLERKPTEGNKRRRAKALELLRKSQA